MNNRWFQLSASLVAMIMIANLQYVWTLFVKPLQHNTGWSLSDIQWAFTLFILCQTWVQPLQAWLIDRLGQRFFVSAAGVLCGAGWAGLGYAKTLTMLYGLYAVAGIGAALVYSASMGSALKWFHDRRGLASGIMAAGFGGGASLFIPVVSSTIRSHGYQTAFIRTGIFQGIAILGVAQFLRHPPVETAATAKTFGGSLPASTQQFTTVEMLTNPRFHVLYLMFVLMATGGLLVTAQVGPMAQSWGLSAATLTLAASLSPVANGASRVLWGWASDRLGRETTMAVAFLLQAVCLMLVTTLGRLSAGWFILTLVLTYLTWGGIYSLFPSTSGDYFGTRHATSNYSVLYTAKGVASIIGGGLAALLYERLGSWSPAFYTSAVMALVAALMALGLRVVSESAPVRVGAPAPPE